MGKTAVELVCVNCGKTYLSDHAQHWGRSAEGTHGYGPTVRCTELVETGDVAAVPAGFNPETFPMEKRKARAICGGTLVYRGS